MEIDLKKSMLNISNDSLVDTTTIISDAETADSIMVPDIDVKDDFNEQNSLIVKEEPWDLNADIEEFQWCKETIKETSRNGSVDIQATNVNSIVGDAKDIANPLTLPELQIKVEKAGDFNEQISTICKTPENLMFDSEEFQRNKTDIKYDITSKSASNNKITLNEVANLKPFIKKTKIFVRNANIKKPIQCAKCQHTFDGQNRLKSHMNIHKRPHKCMLCSKYFANSDCQKQHMDIYHKLAECKCIECDKKFKTKNALDTHNKKQHGIKPIYNCDHCCKKFKIINDLNEHLLIHRKLCILCDEVFTGNENLLFHMKRHSHEQHYKCQACDSIFPLPDLAET